MVSSYENLRYSLGSLSSQSFGISTSPQDLLRLGDIIEQSKILRKTAGDGCTQFDALQHWAIEAIHQSVNITEQHSKIPTGMQAIRQYMEPDAQGGYILFAIWLDKNNRRLHRNIWNIPLPEEKKVNIRLCPESEQQWSALTVENSLPWFSEVVKIGLKVQLWGDKLSKSTSEIVTKIKQANLSIGIQKYDEKILYQKQAYASCKGKLEIVLISQKFDRKEKSLSLIHI